MEAAGDDEDKAPKAEDYEGGENSTAYKAAYEEAVAAKAENDKQAVIDKALIAELEKATSAEEFKRAILAYAFDGAFESAYDAIVSKLGESEPSESELESYKNSVKNLVIEAVLAGKSNIEAELVLGDDATEWEKQQSTLPTTIISKLNTTLSGVAQTATFSVTSNLGQKLFGGVKAEYNVPYKSYEVQGTNAKVGDVWSEDTLVANKNSIVKAIEIYKDMLNDPEYDKEEMEAAIKSLEESLKEAEEEIADTVNTGHYTYTAFFVTEAAHREEAKVRDVGHILFSVDSSITTNTSNTFKTSDEANEAIEALYKEIEAEAVDGVVTKEVFEKFATGKTADSGIFYEDVYTGQMVAEFEDWLFNAEKVGELGLVETDYGWHIMYYGGEGEEATWEYLAHTAAANEKYNEFEEGLNFNATVNDDLLIKYFDGFVAQ